MEEETINQSIVNQYLSMGLDPSAIMSHSAKAEATAAGVLDAKEGFTFGCDPELFIVDGNGVPVCPTFIPGTKEEPHPVEHGAIQRDGMAAEFNTHPAKTFDEFNRNIVEVMKQLKTFLPPGHRFAIVPSLVFPESVFASAPMDARVLGCSPDLDAWTGEKSDPPCRDDNPFLCTAGGHLHIGWREPSDPTTPQHVLNCRDLVKQLDYYLAAWALRVDKDAERRKLYGKAGACRIKEYGVEYRPLSNFWIEDKEKRLKVWNRMQKAIADMRLNHFPSRLDESFNRRLIKSINSSTIDKNIEQIVKYPVVSIIKY